MKELIVKSGKQLALALKMAYAYLNMTDFTVQVREPDKGKIYYVILLDIDDEAFAEFEKTYRTMSM